MKYRKSWSGVVFLLASSALAGCSGGDGGSEVASCARGTLDAAYCDVDGDLVADLPENPADFLDPTTLIFSYTPVEDPAVYAEVWSEFIDHLSAATGKPVTFFPVQSNAAQYEAMRSGRLHIAGINTGGTPVAVNCSGFRPFAMMASNDGAFGYEMEIITHVSSDITDVEGLRGRTLAFTSPTSNSGFKAPSAILKAEFGMIAGEDYETTFSGKHDNSILGVQNRDYDAAAVANEVLHRMFDRDVADERQIRTIYTSDTFPTTAYGHAHNLEPGLAARIRAAFFSFEWEGTALDAEFQDADQFLAITYKADWQIIRNIDAANDIAYDCR